MPEKATKLFRSGTVTLPSYYVSSIGPDSSRLITTLAQKTGHSRSGCPSYSGEGIKPRMGIHSNLNAVQHHLEMAQPALCFLTETQISRPSYNINLFLMHGVCVYVREDICCRRLGNFGGPDRVHIYACVYKKHLMGCVQAAFDNVLAQITSAEIVVLGDFNGHNAEWLGSCTTDYAGRSVHNFALAYGLSQLVESPTRLPDVDSHMPSLLDLLLTTHPDSYQVSPLGTSVHCLVRAVSDCKKQDTGRTKNTQFWSLSKTALGNFNQPSLPPLHMRNDTLAHSAKKKADLLCSSRPEVQFRQNIVRRTLFSPIANSKLDVKAKLASKKLGVINRARQYFKSAHIPALYKAQDRAHMEYSARTYYGEFSEDIIPTIWTCGGPPQCGFHGVLFHVLQSCGMSLIVWCFRDDTTWVPSKKARTPSLTAGNAPVISLVLQENVGGGDHLTSGDLYACLYQHEQRGLGGAAHEYARKWGPYTARRVA
ncbi:unnamed protein product [Leptidea sinapis]|uniref:Endonuclease/exonuclease/phosphatase domain-containing protein n=1 Tax=Leptidea sinapis TaxID=189913 RepID=A0A5E4PXH4_9NEOP|nr:unnamed protein product [Leptidea sinapis]